MKITIISVGKIKEKYFVNAIKEYIKRLGRYSDIKEIEVSDEKCPENLSEKDIKIVKDKEGNKILSKITEQMYVITLEIDGKNLSSEELSKKIENLMITGKSHIAFVIGGSLGLSNNVLKRSNFKLSFSKMTFPHQLMKVILLEQIYRSFRIMKGEPYHK